MKRLIMYGVAGMIVGLLLENRTILLKQDVKDKTRKLKHKLNGHLPRKLRTTEM